MKRMGRIRINWTNGIRRFGLGLVSGAIFASPVWAQTTPPTTQGKSGSGAKSSAPQGDKTRKMTEQERRAERARELFADAANAQNNGAYELAIEQWAKMLSEFPDNALAPSARHFLGICYQELSPPDYDKAIDAFRSALKAPELKEKEESLINLGWCLFQQSTAVEPVDQAKLTEATKSFNTFLEKFQDSPLADKALFYVGEAESRLGHPERAIQHFNQLLSNRSYAKSPLRSDAMFSLGLAYEEAKQNKLAMETYQTYLTEFPKSTLATDATVRMAELALQSDQVDKAVTYFANVVNKPELEKLGIADYVLYRYAFALAKAGQFAKSSEAYKQLSEKFPKSTYATNASLAIGQTLMRDKKYDEAARAFERLLPARDERAAEAAHWMCQIAILRNRAKDAAPIAREALQWVSKWDPKSVSPTMANMTILLRMDLADGLFATADGKAEARKLYEQIAVESTELPICPRATYNAAFAALQAGDHAAAQRWAEAFTKRFSNDELASDVAYIRAESLLQLAQYESAATAFEQLIRSTPNHPSVAAWDMRAATALYLGGNFEGSYKRASSALQRKLEPATKAEALFLQGACLLKQQKTTDAIPSLEASLKTDAKWAQADETLLLLSQAYEATKSPDKAKKSLERLLEEFPTSRFRQQAEFKLGQLAAGSQDLEGALSWYDRALKSANETPLLDYIRYDKAFVLIQLDRFPEALELVQKVNISTKNPALLRECKIAQAICLRRTQRAADAIPILTGLDPSNASDPSAPKVLYELGLAYSSVQDFPRAIDALESLISKFPKYELIDRAHFELAWAYKSSGNPDAANRWFQTIADRFPNSPLAAESFFHVGQSEFENAKFDSAVKAYTVAATKSSSPELQEKSLYKLGLSLFQQKEFASASEQFNKQLKSFPNGSLSVDARLMLAECSLKLEKFSTAWPQYEQARKALESHPDASQISDQVKAMIYLHGAQAARELKRWNDVDAWIAMMQQRIPDSNLDMVAKYEQAFAKQNLKKTDEALKLYEEVAEGERNALGARAQFMMGELYFADRNFAKAITEFQKTMYGYGGTQAPEDVKNWQARAAFEAGRCSEVFIADLSGERRKKAVDTAVKFYQFILDNHEGHEMEMQARQRIIELKK